MDEIPEDIAIIANGAVGEMNLWRIFKREEIAKLLMAERERCVKIAERIQDESDSYNGTYDGIADVIAAIRNRT